MIDTFTLSSQLRNFGRQAARRKRRFERPGVRADVHASLLIAGGHVRRVRQAAATVHLLCIVGLSVQHRAAGARPRPHLGSSAGCLVDSDGVLDTLVHFHRAVATLVPCVLRIRPARRSLLARYE